MEYNGSICWKSAFLLRSRGLGWTSNRWTEYENSEITEHIKKERIICGVCTDNFLALQQNNQVLFCGIGQRKLQSTFAVNWQLVNAVIALSNDKFAVVYSDIGRDGILSVRLFQPNHGVSGHKVLHISCTHTYTHSARSYQGAWHTQGCSSTDTLLIVGADSLVCLCASTGSWVVLWQVELAPALTGPVFLAISPRFAVAVIADGDQEQGLVFDVSTGQRLHRIQMQSFGTAECRIQDHFIFLSSFRKDTVICIDAETGLECSRAGAIIFKQPCTICPSVYDRILLTTSGNNRAKMFSWDEKGVLTLKHVIVDHKGPVKYLDSVDGLYITMSSCLMRISTAEEVSVFEYATEKSDYESLGSVCYSGVAELLILIIYDRIVMLKPVHGV